MHKFDNGILFYHDKAGQGDVHEIVGEVTKHLSQMITHLTIYRSLEQGEIYELLTRSSQPYDIFLILGGDGTVHELINGMIDGGYHKLIGILPGGTFNDFTKTLNLNPDPVRAATQLLESEITYYDVLKTNERYALNFAGMGLMVDNSEGVNPQVKSKIGKFSYFLSMIKNVSNPTFFDYEIEVDGNKSYGTSSMIVIANGQFVGGNRIPLSELSPSDGTLNVFIFKDSGLKIFTDMIGEKSEVNWNEISQNIEHISGEHVYLKTKEELSVDVDGEIDLVTPLDVRIVPNKLKILTAPVNKLF
ncbi:diacylglycerol/lipid kinase family protein [Macrococcoides caseolyticum]|uniref:diacylglycerol/lipid kinase family protein n=1 Tax=Macrococcoides caseolyticum TaxID=69966 RepID=UPI000A28E770|nr:diacylglycerol kinase family protein [Macrococcus caseolyticus]ARQ03832.1 Putative lipid kinase [Macrococcus caseolyticus]PKD99854.1 lipid kinase [Macrococcus caseolyticus]PKE06955.1 lipid kinase [Macrococcus caseolyticus]PKE12884.1 lipid kinase [Macrococcus caseolyticus]PKE17627.1 lipid kinase [Macrococcus caseolyticus]